MEVHYKTYWRGDEGECITGLRWFLESPYQSGLGINMPDLAEAAKRARLQGLIQ